MIWRILSVGRGAAPLLAALLIAPPLSAADDVPSPHFLSIRTKEVNLRTGPGKRYPVDWVFTRRGLPVELLASYDNWRQVRAKDGTTGWIHQSMLSRRRTVVIDRSVSTLLAKPQADAAIVARAEPGVIGELLECEQGWCRIEVSGLRGWLPKAGLWGVDTGDGR